MSALVEKKTGFDGSRTLIQGGFCAWCKAGSIFAQDIKRRLSTSKGLKSKLRPTQFRFNAAQLRSPRRSVRSIKRELVSRLETTAGRQPVRDVSLALSVFL